MAASERPTPDVLWRPGPERITASGVTAFADWLRQNRDLDFASYDEMWRWSTERIEDFWGAVWDWAGIEAAEQPREVLAERVMPGADWFPGARLNYAEHALAPGRGREAGALALVFEREDGLTGAVTYGQLRNAVAAVASSLRKMGVGRDDVVVGVLPNSPHAVVAFLATVSLGAIWSSCAPEFGAHSILERFAQLRPKVLFGVDAYHYAGEVRTRLEVIEQVSEQLDSLVATVIVPYAGTSEELAEIEFEGDYFWAEMLADTAALHFEPVPFDHPLWVLFSSGTTGLPKGIVQGHGGILLEHYKALGIHCDIKPGDRLFWYTTTGWMMWNFLVSGLLLGGTPVLYDGSPGARGMDVLWRMAEETEPSLFGVSAPYLQACMKAGLRPGREHDLSGVRILGSTGAPLTDDGFGWIHDEVSPDILIGSLSGGTDVCTAFVGPASVLPVYRGEIQCRMLGAAVAAYDERGEPLDDEVGELVVTEPMPSMPVAFWDDPDGSRLREAYFEDFPGVWRHGDWVRITPRGSVVISGRSDATLKRGGVRMGTSEFYRVVEAHPDVADSLVVDLSEPGQGGDLVLFVVPGEGVAVDDRLRGELSSALRGQLSPRHVPDRIVAVDVVPRTLNGKKCEVPVKRILLGADPATAVSRSALAHPESLTPYLAFRTAREPG